MAYPSRNPELQIKEITSITPYEVKYTIYNDAAVSWVIPKNSTFDLNEIRVGGAYRVWTRDIGKGRKDYDWEVAMPVGTKTKDLHKAPPQPLAPAPAAQPTVRETLYELINISRDASLPLSTNQAALEAIAEIVESEMFSNAGLFL